MNMGIHVWAPGARSVAVLVAGLLVTLAAGSRPAAAKTPTGAEIVARVLDADPWGLAGADVVARALLRDASGRVRELAFVGRSLRYADRLSKGLVRFVKPADLAGTSFLQIQKADGDDDRYLFLPDLKRSRRIAGNLRKSSFMGTDFAYGDLDRRDLRDCEATLAGVEKLGAYQAYRVVAKPRGSGALYGSIEIWVRKDDLVPLKWKMYSRSGALLKTLVAHEVKKIEGRWFIVRSTMTDNQGQTSTELVLDQVSPGTKISDDEFTVRNLEKY